jgi:hypothetical protein
MGREIGARKLARLGQAVDLPAIAQSGPRSSRLAPWWLPKAAEPTAPATAGLSEPGHVARCWRAIGGTGDGAGRRQERRPRR